ncbi:uncharacterized protein LOC123876975 isoform X3 [Maniola jurtina]|uniref:uncharacterized protein LOC123876975 isoform X3 n=1 Tax=Maniola jurtina TaxID=191418 RepID=UPI001E689E34|nr:uncharacterized protein LOC123876975 isoform X3 [Maniola jurtina]
MKRMRPWIVLLVISVSQCHEKGLTPHELTHIDEIKDVAGFGDAEHRGPQWYEYKSSGETSDDTKSRASQDSSSLDADTSASSGLSSEASSMETDEKKRATKMYRTCTPCPHEMMKKYRNFGIKWICGGYQRARRSFKSECMMRYRNCQDGTMFVKLYDHRCENDPHHGRHWFYIYKT